MLRLKRVVLLPTATQPPVELPEMRGVAVRLWRVIGYFFIMSFPRPEKLVHLENEIGGS